MIAPRYPVQAERGGIVNNVVIKRYMDRLTIGKNDFEVIER
jgi:hypothetical protein